MDAASPTQTVLQAGRMWRMVSKIAIPARDGGEGQACFQQPEVLSWAHARRLVGRTPRTCSHGPSRRVHVDGDVLLGVNRVEVEELGHDEVGHVVVDGTPKANNALQMRAAHVREMRQQHTSLHDCNNQLLYRSAFIHAHDEALEPLDTFEALTWLKS